MSQTKNIVIGIQARMTNTRLPGKVKMLIAGMTMLDRVIKNAEKCSRYINNGNTNLKVTVALLVPTGDPLADEYRSKMLTIEGPEDDVLQRYYIASKLLEPDYVVRLTSDCPLIPPFLITKHIVNACNYEYDYVSNVDPEVRTAPDGFDCEVISSRLLDWTHENAKSVADREHVTTHIRSNRPDWAKVANIVGYTDLSHLKLSVDTKEDLFFVRTYFDILSNKIKKAQSNAEGFFRL